MYVVLSTLFCLSGILLVVFVLLRKGEGGGLSGAFGGMGGDTAFGVKAAKHLDRIIAIVACIFLGSAILMNTRPFRKKPSRLAETSIPEASTAPESSSAPAPTVPTQPPSQETE